MVSPRCLNTALEDAKTAEAVANKTPVEPEKSTEEQKQIYQRKHDLVQTEEDTTKGGDDDEMYKQNRNTNADDWWSWSRGWWKSGDWQSWYNAEGWESWELDRNRPWCSRDWSWDSKADTESLKAKQFGLRPSTLDQINYGQDDSQVPKPDTIDENKGVRFVEKDTNKEVLAGFCYETKLFWLKRPDGNHEVQMSPSPDELGIPENVQKLLEKGTGDDPTKSKEVVETKKETGGEKEADPTNSNEEVKDGQASTKEAEEKKKETGGGEKEADPTNSNEEVKDGQASTKEAEEKKKETGGGEKEADPTNSNEEVKDGQASTKAEEAEEKKKETGGEKEADPKNSKEEVKDGQASTKAEEAEEKKKETGGEKEADPKNSKEEVKDGQASTKAEEAEEKKAMSNQEVKAGEGTGGGKNANKADPKDSNREVKEGEGKELVKVEDVEAGGRTRSRRTSQKEKEK